MPLKCEIVTQERTVFNGDADYVSLPGQEGMLGILPNHSPLLTTLAFGEVYVRHQGETLYFAVGGGFAEVQPDKVIVLADSAERADEIDLERAAAARERAKKEMQEGTPKDPTSYQAMEDALRRAKIRMTVATRRSSRSRSGPPGFGGQH
jgi:F-type H+-transporting ATPase subunit epsilon